MYLAVHDGHRSIGEVAQFHGISKNHLMKIAQRLVAEGFVEAVRGRSGGLRLAWPATHINVGQVARIMEETGQFVECFDPETNSCVITPVCGLRHAMADALEAFFQCLDQHSIADVNSNHLTGQIGQAVDRK